MALLNQGTTLSVTHDGASVRIGAVRSVGEVKLDSDMVDVTTLDAPGGFRLYMQGMKSAADLQVDGYLDAAQQGQRVLRALYQSGAPAAFEITYPDGESCVFNAFCKSVSMGGGEVDAVARFACTLRITGEVTVQ